MVQNEIAGSNQPSKAFSNTLSQFINLNKSGGSVLTFGNLLTLPISGGMLFVEPIYVQGGAAVSYTHLDVYKRQGKDTPAADSAGRLGAYEPRIYFGEQSPSCLLYTSRCV